MAHSLLNECINECVVAQWAHADGRVATLGSVLPTNGEDSWFMLKVSLGPALEAFVRFTLSLSLCVHGRSRRRPVMLVLPASSLASRSFAFETLKIPETGALAPALHGAGFSDNGFVLAATFSLKEPGYVTLPTSNLEVIRPTNATASNILAGLKSLSQTLDFTVFLKPSDYARTGLKCIADHLRNDALNPLGLILAAEVGANLAPLDWSRCELFGSAKKARRHETKSFPRHSSAAHPPPYNEQDNALPVVCVERSLSPSCNVPESPQPPALVSSPDAATLRTRVDLEGTLAMWITQALTVNPTVYCHPHLRPTLRAMGRHARASDLHAFRAARARCAALFFYEPHANAAVDHAQHMREFYVTDMERLLAWMLDEEDGDCFADFMAWADLLALGDAARDAVASSDNVELKDKYNRAKGICVSKVLAEYG
ncbi:uncharacterized protein LTHEOB_12877 [Lasiodiplodia theobromae]|uniref:uncharacterized protein n=1 Tax=Lasiodiplodia theobromae TaxID=45133 RepID=UPI0015C3C369|nr:uncharacterized protein LTHEOB_12877 [Lasiodiplodia theobromae]KAF4534689.1 hypothetical protein LTHEOB_12877 [Lasiodiplodia theobromae]